MALEFYNKHYVRVGNNGLVIKAFSDAFEQPESGDICVNEQGERHYNLELFTFPEMAHKYKLVNGKVVETTEAERKAEIASFAPPPKSEIELLKEQLAQQNKDFADFMDFYFSQGGTV